MITWIDVARVWAAVAVLIGLLAWELRQLSRYLQSKKHRLDCMWRPHTELPTYQPTTALVAFISEEDDRPFCASEPYAWNGSEWFRESDGVPLQGRAFWWMDESALLAQVPTQVGKP